eukprot:Anaeramoba_ignava/c17745_g1_i1.p2 GENE.c17745_g1_i1~~c17745_g1_i1.p2  ORF type:complete len:101 (-),score=4.59 c17745_g1_i1:562-864(-)
MFLSIASFNSFTASSSLASSSLKVSSSAFFVSIRLSSLMISSLANEICSFAISSSSCKAFTSFSVFASLCLPAISSSLSDNSFRWISFLILLFLISSIVA